MAGVFGIQDEFEGGKNIFFLYNTPISKKKKGIV